MHEEPKGLRVLILGSGAREHAIGARFAASPDVADVVVAPGNGGTACELRNAALADMTDAVAVVAIARHERVDLVVIGPEAPLVVGVGSALREAGFAVFGPGGDGAKLEASKAYGKEFAAKYAIPTAAGRAFSDAVEAHAYLGARGAGYVVKADGLCAGKGVVVASDVREAHEAVDRMLVRRVFGDAGSRIVIEDLIEGEEVSVHVITDGKRYLVLPAVQDHKRIGEGDTGENTGGMGAYGPAPVMTDRVLARTIESIIEPTLRGLVQEGIDYRGVLFFGLMIDAAGEPILLEYNTRFGDPETAVLMALLDDDAAHLFFGAARGALPREGIAQAREHAAAVVLAAAGYPGSPRTGDIITGLEAAHDVQSAFVLHGGTNARDGEIVTAGGRVLAVTATGVDLREALARAYLTCDAIAFEGKQLRRDIGHRALARLDAR